MMEVLAVASTCMPPSYHFEICTNITSISVSIEKKFGINQNIWVVGQNLQIASSYDERGSPLRRGGGEYERTLVLNG